MDVGVQDEPHREVTNYVGDSFDVHAVLQSLGSESVAEVV